VSRHTGAAGLRRDRCTQRAGRLASRAVDRRPVPRPAPLTRARNAPDSDPARRRFWPAGSTPRCANGCRRSRPGPAALDVSAMPARATHYASGSSMHRNAVRTPRILPFSWRRGTVVLPAFHSSRRVERGLVVGGVRRRCVKCQCWRRGRRRFCGPPRSARAAGSRSTAGVAAIALTSGRDNHRAAASGWADAPAPWPPPWQRRVSSWSTSCLAPQRLVLRLALCASPRRRWQIATRPTPPCPRWPDLPPPPRHRCAATGRRREWLRLREAQGVRRGRGRRGAGLARRPPRPKDALFSGADGSPNCPRR